MRLRNPLFAPADSERKIARALGSSADAVILDLEDSVAPASKPSARAAAVAVLAANAGSRGLIVRVNDLASRWYLADLAAVIPGRPLAILLPKCAGRDDVARLDHHLEALEASAGLQAGNIGILALVESAAGVEALDYRGATPRLRALVFGAEDLAADLGISARDPSGAYRSPLAAARSALLAAAALAGVAAIDSPWPQVRDPDGLRVEAQAAADDGFTGKACVHPDQLDPVAAIFTPAADRVRWAAAVCEAFAAAPATGVVTIDGRMADGAHLKLARRILDAAGASSA